MKEQAITNSYWPLIVLHKCYCRKSCNFVFVGTLKSSLRSIWAPTSVIWRPGNGTLTIEHLLFKRAPSSFISVAPKWLNLASEEDALPNLSTSSIVEAHQRQRLTHSRSKSLSRQASNRGSRIQIQFRLQELGRAQDFRARSSYGTWPSLGYELLLLNCFKYDPLAWLTNDL